MYLFLDILVYVADGVITKYISNIAIITDPILMAIFTFYLNLFITLLL